MNEKTTILITFLDKVIHMTTFPKAITEIFRDYQIEIEDWVTRATLEEIKEYLLLIHGFVYPIDWLDFINGHFNHSQKTSNDKNYTPGCIHCQEIILAIYTISEISRPELKQLFEETK